MKALFLLLIVGAAFALSGCGSSSADEGGVSTATPANKLSRPGPVGASGSAPSQGAAEAAGTLSEGN